MSAYKNVSNLTNPNWVYGNSTPDQQRIDYFKEITSNNVTFCPEQTPFVLKNTTNCSKCPQNTPYFDVSSRLCVACGVNSTFSLEKRQCLNSTNGTNATNATNQTCPTSQIFNNNTRACECPSFQPFYNGQACLSCYLPNFWNSTNLSCQSCPNGSIYNITIQSCQACPS